MDNKGKGSIEDWAQTKARGGNGIVEKNINRRGVEKTKERSVEYLTIGCKVGATFIIFEMCRKEGV